MQHGRRRPLACALRERLAHFWREQRDVCQEGSHHGPLASSRVLASASALVSAYCVVPWREPKRILRLHVGAFGYEQPRRSQPPVQRRVVQRRVVHICQGVQLSTMQEQQCNRLRTIHLGGAMKRRGIVARASVYISPAVDQERQRIEVATLGCEVDGREAKLELVDGSREFIERLI